MGKVARAVGIGGQQFYADGEGVCLQIVGCSVLEACMQGLPSSSWASSCICLGRVRRVGVLLGVLKRLLTALGFHSKQLRVCRVLAQELGQKGPIL